MIGVKIKTKIQTQRVAQQAKQKNIESLGHAGAAIRLIANRSIRRRKGPSPVGEPPHTHTKRLPRAIKYAVEKQRRAVIIGPDVESIGTVGRAHEYGGLYKQERYQPRPFMRPALEKIRSRLPKFWASSIK